MIAGIPRKLYGSAVVALTLRGQRSTPFLPREQIEALRDRRIRRLTRYAARWVPYYRTWFARERIDPRDIHGAAELERLPVLDKEIVRAHPRQFLAEAPAARGALSFLTSGSTGVPIEIHHDRASLLANLAFGERERDPVNNTCGSFRPKELYIGYETSTFKKVIAFYEDSMLFPVRPRRRFVSLQEPLERVAEIVNAERPDVLVGYGGWIDLFFRTVAARRFDLHLPRMVMYMGEALPHGGREFIEGTFGVPVFSRYNAVESFKIGFFCEHRAGFHVHEDLCHVQIRGSDGNTLPAGEQGEIVISNLINQGSVLLNYPIGDMASMSSHTCPCGRSFRLLSELEGRVEDILPLADGRFVHPRSVWQVFKNDRDILQYQLTQHEPRRFELTLVTVDRETFDRALKRALPDLRGLLGPDVLIETHHRTEFVRRPGSKFRAVVSRCGTPVAD